MASITALPRPENEWKADCLKWRGRVLTGSKSHWCYEWDGLPIDETTMEWPCNCAEMKADALPEGEQGETQR